MKNETIEEAAERLIREDPDFEVEGFSPYQNGKLNGFIQGAYWKQERMYSEEEVIILLQKYRFDLSSGITPNIGDTTVYWFENFKK